MSPLATRFRLRHQAPTPLVLPNAWDACSAVMMQRLGAEAIATTSAGMAWALGYPDGDALPIDLHAAVIRQITRVVTCPVTTDAEGGYSEDPLQAGDHVARLIDAGAVGINLEDGSASPESLCRKIDAVKAVAARAGVDLFVNARTDVYLRGLAPGRDVEEVLQRARRYAEAGADGLFAPGARTEVDIAALVTGQRLPVNVMACPGLPGLADLSRLGVRRLSAGSAVAQLAWAAVQRAGASFLAEGSSDALFADSCGYGDLNALFARV